MAKAVYQVVYGGQSHRFQLAAIEAEELEPERLKLHWRRALLAHGSVAEVLEDERLDFSPEAVKDLKELGAVVICDPEMLGDISKENFDVYEEIMELSLPAEASEFDRPELIFGLEVLFGWSNSHSFSLYSERGFDERVTIMLLLLGSEIEGFSWELLPADEPVLYGHFASILGV